MYVYRHVIENTEFTVIQKETKTFEKTRIEIGLMQTYFNTLINVKLVLC